MNEFLWVEKYRPQTISECVLPNRLKDVFQSFVDQKEIPNMLLCGTAGTGKTTVARALCNELDCDYIVQSDTLTNYFGCDHDFICHNSSWDVSGNDVFRHDRFMTQNWFEMRWATVVYFKKNEHAKRIFDAWQMVYENYAYYAELFGFSKSPFRNDFAMSIAHQICNGYVNIATFDYALPALSSSDSVLDYNNGRWLLKYQYKESHNVMRYTGDLHVMNKRSLLEVADRL